jgi:hypothetical protein
MRYLILLMIFGCTAPTYTSKRANRLVAPPPGATLPVTLVKSIKSARLVVGEPVIGRFIQRVPLSADSYLPTKVEVLGDVVSTRPT